METRSTLASLAPVTVKCTIGHVSKQQVLGLYVFNKPAASVCAGHAFKHGKDILQNTECRMQNTKLLLKLVIRVRKLSESGSI